ncbi:DNA endonuclease IV [Acinetobacter phage Henu6]|jgi:hypothetical protein|uniref:DNA endonuclease IV n=2 Tax=Caudoviricetes TaxID=2731619 RepID=A0A410T5A3_9CAUD|nr:DNA endonuclease IV [Acinetobacter phage Henu6]
MQENKAWIHLTTLKPITLGVSDLTPESKQKVIDTTKHALEYNGETDTESVLQRCVIAQLAEQYIAQHMKGHCINDENVNINDPWTYAFDVLAGPEYYGMRIEVKTQQSGAKWVSVNTGQSGLYPGSTGLNIKPFLTTGIPDIIVIFKTTELHRSVWTFEPFLIANQEGLKEVVQKSNFTGYYINDRQRPSENNSNYFFYKGLH